MKTKITVFIAVVVLSTWTRLLMSESFSGWWRTIVPRVAVSWWCWLGRGRENNNFEKTYFPILSNEMILFSTHTLPYKVRYTYVIFLWFILHFITMIMIQYIFCRDWENLHIENNRGIFIGKNGKIKNVHLD